MVIILFYIFALFFGYRIFTEKGVKKLTWFLGGVLFFPPAVVLIKSPFITFSKFTLICLLVVTFKDFKWLALYKNFPFRKAMLVMLISSLIIGMTADGVSFFYAIYKPLNYFLTNFFVLFLTWYYIKDLKDVRFIFDRLFFFFILFAVYGISNYITKENPYNSIITEGFSVVRDIANENMSVSAERFRISSFTWQAILYGLLLDLIIFIELFLLTSNTRLSSQSRITHIIVLVFLLINLLMTNSRTPVFALLIGGIIYFLLGLNFKYKLWTLIVSTFFFIIAISVSTQFAEFVDKAMYTFSNDQTAYEQGSSVSMREGQLDASLLIFARSPVHGYGFDYIQEGLGFSSDTNKRKSENDLFGFESYVYKLLIEQGSIGIIANIVFAVMVFAWLFKMLNKVNLDGRKAIYITMAMFIAFIAFIIGTGDLGSFTFFMAVLGINVKLIMLCQKDLALFQK